MELKGPEANASGPFCLLFSSDRMECSFSNTGMTGVSRKSFVSAQKRTIQLLQWLCIMFVTQIETINTMQSRSTSSSTTTVLVVIVLLLSFPLWIGLIGGLFGLVVGLFGAAFGIIAGIMGAIFGVFTGLIGWMFDFDFPGFNFHFFPGKFFIAVLLIALLVVALNKRR
jgi:hypothetical protein